MGVVTNRSLPFSTTAAATVRGAIRRLRELSDQ